VATLSSQQAACALKQAGWPETLIPTMVSVGKAESGLRTEARNAQGISASGGSGGFHATGWLQVVDFPDRAARWNLQDPLQNAQAAKAVYDAQGLGAWSTYPGASARYLAGVQQDLAGFDFGKCGAPVAATAGAGTGLLRGRASDPWGIGQGIADSVGYTGSTLGGIGRTLEGSGTVLLGLLILGLGVVLLGRMFLTETAAGRLLKRAGGDLGRAAAAVAPK